MYLKLDFNFTALADCLAPAGTKLGLVWAINSLWSSDVIWLHGTLSSLVQVMACHWYAMKPLPEPMMTYCKLDFREQTSMTSESKYQILHKRKFCLWNCEKLPILLRPNCHLLVLRLHVWKENGRQDPIKSLTISSVIWCSLMQLGDTSPVWCSLMAPQQWYCNIGRVTLMRKVAWQKFSHYDAMHL